MRPSAPWRSASPFTRCFGETVVPPRSRGSCSARVFVIKVVHAAFLPEIARAFVADTPAGKVYVLQVNCDCHWYVCGPGGAFTHGGGARRRFFKSEQKAFAFVARETACVPAGGGA